VRTRVLCLSFFFALQSLPLVAFAQQDRTVEMQARFDHESDSVHRAKLFEKLGDEQLAQTRKASATDDYPTVGKILEKYRDNARIALDSLKKQHPDAEKKLGGYKQLQMHIYKGIREVDETLVVTPADFRPPLQLVRQDLLAIDNELLQSLFPHRPSKKNAPPAVLLSPEKP
jgi:hypothetical protein